MEKLIQDLRYGFRMLFKNPSFTIVTVLSLIFGIGANTAIFSLADEMLIRPLPVDAPARLVMLSTSNQFGSNTAFNYALYKDYRDQNEVFDGLIAYSDIPLSLSSDTQPKRVYGMIVTGNYFSVLGVKPILGRAFLPEEDQTPGSHPVAIVSHGLWQSRFGADTNLPGKTISLNGQNFTVIGVAPPEFNGTIRGFTPDVYVPMMMVAQAMGRQGLEPLTSRGFNWLSVIGRLKPGTSREQAEAGMRILADQVAQVNPMNTERQIVLKDAGRGDTALVSDLSTPLWLLLIIVALVLLIACANVANLLLARASIRHKEMAIRLAVGAGRRRIVRQLLTESVLLSTLGGIGGVLLALWIGNSWAKFNPPGGSTPVSLSGSIDLRALAFAFLLMLLTGIIFGLAPALFASKPDIIMALKNEKIIIGGGKRQLNVRDLLVIAQVSLSLAVLICAGLCIKSLQNLQNIDAGLDLSKTITMSFNLRLNGYSKDQGQQFYRQVIEQISTMPGVEAASLVEVVPLGGSGMRRTVKLEGYEPRPNEATNIDFNVISPGYFETMSIPIIQGRDFSPQDVMGTQPVIIINQMLTDRYWPGQNPIGKHIRLPGSGGNSEQSLEIIGVVRNSKYRSLTEDIQPFMYLPLQQNYASEVALQARCATDPKTMLYTVRNQINSLDSKLPVFDIKTLDEHKNMGIYSARLAAVLLSALATLALFMAAVGIYGVMAYAVSQRTNEIGIRIALGAQRNDVLKLIMRNGIWLVVVGVMFGIAGAFAATRFIASFLYGISATDPNIFVAASLLLTAVTLLASYIPSRRAMKVDPIIAIKNE